MNTMMQAGIAGRSGPALVIRINGLLFHAVAMASLMESASALYVYRVLPALEGLPALSAWVEKSWWPMKCARGRALRDYVEEMWPEFDWPAAFERYYMAQRVVPSPGSADTGLYLLSYLVAAAQCALFYRSLAGWVDDHRLRELVAAAADEEADAFNRFRGGYETAGCARKLGAWASLRSALHTIRVAAQHPVRDAYVAVATVHQASGTPGGMASYGEFVRRMLQVIERQARLGWMHRVLLKPWRELASAARSPAPVPATTHVAALDTGRSFAGWRALG